MRARLDQLNSILETHGSYFKLYQLYSSMEFHREFAGNGVVPNAIANPHFDYREQLVRDRNILWSDLDQAKQYKQLYAKVLELCTSMKTFARQLVSSPEYIRQKEEYIKDDMKHGNIADMLVDLLDVAKRNNDNEFQKRFCVQEFLRIVCLPSAEYSPLYKIWQKYWAFQVVRPRFNSPLRAQEDISRACALSRQEFLTCITKSLVLDYGHVYRELLPQLDQMIEAERLRWQDRQTV